MGHLGYYEIYDFYYNKILGTVYINLNLFDQAIYF